MLKKLEPNLIRIIEKKSESGRASSTLASTGIQARLILSGTLFWGQTRVWTVIILVGRLLRILLGEVDADGVLASAGSARIVVQIVDVVLSFPSASTSTQMFLSTSLRTSAPRTLKCSPKTQIWGITVGTSKLVQYSNGLK